MNIESSVLSNGIRAVTLFDDKTDIATIKVNVTIGSINEIDNLNGISHALEHMMFKSTKSMSAYEISNIIEQTGADMNAYTNYHETCFYITGLKTYFEQYAKILGTMLSKGRCFNDEELNIEKNVILQELAMYNDDPNSVLLDNIQKISHKNQSFGRNILGTFDNIKNFTVNDLQTYKEQYYIAPNIIISCCGNIKHEDFVKMIEKYFDFSNGVSTPEIVEYLTEPVCSHIEMPHLEQTSVLYAFPSWKAKNDEDMQVSVLSALLSNGISSPLVAEIREKRGLVYTTGSSQSSSYNSGIFTIYGGMNCGSVEEFLTSSFKLLEDSVDNIKEVDLVRAKNQFKFGFAQMKESNANTLSQIISNLRIDNRLISDEYIQEYIQKVDALTVKDMSNTMQKLLQSKPYLSIVGKIDKPIETLHSCICHE